jgi:N4-gp56 family major capsid protein
MPGQTYGTQVGRHEKYKGRILAKAQTQEMLTKLGTMEEIPQNSSDNIEWMRFLPYGGVDNQWLAAGGDTDFINKHIVQEGVTPSADSIAWTTLTATLQQIGCLYSYTDKKKYVHEEGNTVPPEMEDQAAARIVLAREMMTYGEMKSCTNQFFGGAGTNVATVNGPPSISMFQNISRAILGAHGITVNKMLKSGPAFGMQSVQASWPVYCHTDMEKTFENMVGFTKVNNYGANVKLLDDDYEIGAVGRFRIIVNPILTYQPGAGAAVAGWTGTGAAKSDVGTDIDVYPLIAIGRGKAGGDAFGQVALRGMNAIDSHHIPPSERSKSDMLGQRGYVSAQTWQSQAVLNDAWMAVAFVGTEA